MIYYPCPDPEPVLVCFGGDGILTGEIQIFNPKWTEAFILIIHTSYSAAAYPLL